MQRRAALLSVLALAGAWGLGACHQREPRVVLIGDSTMADYPPARAPLSGWGQALRERLRGKAEVINRAVPGSSTLSYSRANWQKTVTRLRKGDLLLIQFGHNDERPDPWHNTKPRGQYRHLLTRFVKDASDAGAIPVLMTPIPRYRFSEGRVSDTHGHYAESVRGLAREKGVPLVDLATLAAEEMERQGEIHVRPWYMLYFDGHDDVHLTNIGAKNMAIMVESELVRHGLL